MTISTHCHLRALLGALALGWLAMAANAQVTHDPPMIYQPQDVLVPVDQPETLGVNNVLQAISWYIPNRLGDLSDVPRFYMTLGSGLGATVRATKLFYFSHYDSDAKAIGWNGRRGRYGTGGGSIFFGEQIDESYVGFLAAQEGRIQRDPSELGLSLSLWAIGANFALSGAELLDAVTGIVGIDLMGDDRGPVLYEQVPAGGSHYQRGPVRGQLEEPPAVSVVPGAQPPLAVRPQSVAPQVVPAPAPPGN